MAQKEIDKPTNSEMEIPTTPLKKTSRPSYFRYAPLDHAAAGLGAGFFTTCCLHPLDLIKTRLQVQDSAPIGRIRYRNTAHALTSIVKSDGIRGLYQGITPNILGNVVAWGSYFLVYNALKNKIQAHIQADHLGPQHHMMAATVAGVGTQLLGNPLWVVKTRMCYQMQGTPGAYKNVIDAFQSIWRLEGLRGIYKGLIPGLFGVSHGVIHFVVYEDLKRRYPLQDPSGKHSVSQYIAMAATSKIVASLSTYPYQLLRSRLQNQTVGKEVYRNVTDCIKKIWRIEGIQGFYRGLGANILRVTPATCITFLVYEQLSHVFKTHATIHS